MLSFDHPHGGERDGLHQRVLPRFLPQAIRLGVVPTNESNDLNPTWQFAAFFWEVPREVILRERFAKIASFYNSFWPKNVLLVRCLLLQIALPGHFHQQVVVLDWRHDAILWLNCGGTCVWDWVQQSATNFLEKCRVFFKGFFLGGKLCRVCNCRFIPFFLKIEDHVQVPRVVNKKHQIHASIIEGENVLIYWFLGLIVSLRSSLLSVTGRLTSWWLYTIYMLFWYLTMHYNKIFPYIHFPIHGIFPYINKP